MSSRHTRITFFLSLFITLCGIAWVLRSCSSSTVNGEFSSPWALLSWTFTRPSLTFLQKSHSTACGCTRDILFFGTNVEDEGEKNFEKCESWKNIFKSRITENHFAALTFLRFFLCLQLRNLRLVSLEYEIQDSGTCHCYWCVGCGVVPFSWLQSLTVVPQNSKEC